MKLITRYLLKELLSIFSLFVGAFYLLFILIESTTRMKGVPFAKALLYYLYQFSALAELLFPLGLCLATTKVLCSLNGKNELLALQSSAISLKTILRPFYFFAATLTALLFLNFEYGTPRASCFLNSFKHTYIKKSKQSSKEIKQMRLADHSLLLYDSYDDEKEVFLDAFWIVNFDEIYRMKSLHPEKNPLGVAVEHLLRDEQGEMKRKESYDTFRFTKMAIDTKALGEATYTPESQSLSGMLQHNASLAKLSPVFFYRLTIAFFPLWLLAVLSPACLKFSRQMPLFLIYAFSLSGVIAFLALAKGSLGLGQSGTMPPFLAILFPYLVFFAFFALKRYTKGIFTTCICITVLQLT